MGLLTLEAEVCRDLPLELAEAAIRFEWNFSHYSVCKEESPIEMTMTAIEQLQRQLEALPPDVREAEATRLLDLLNARVHKQEIGALPASEPVPYERVAHLSGVFKGGPTDLASYKRYLEGLGQSSMR